MVSPEDFEAEYKHKRRLPDYANLIPLLFQLRDMLPTIKCPDCGTIGKVTHLQIGPTATTGKCRNCQNIWNVPGEHEEGMRRHRLEKEKRRERGE